MYPKITIVTPSFNQAKYLETTIISIVKQNYPNLEYIIMDGGSTDGSIDIIKKYEDKISKWVSEKDSGQSDAVSRGFTLATGDLLGWVNSDDALFPSALDKIAKLYNSHKPSMIIGATARGSNNDGGIISTIVPPPKWVWMPKYCFFHIGQMSTFFSRKLYHSVGGINKNLFYRLDTDLFYRMILTKPKIRQINSHLGFIRYHSETKTNNSDLIRQKELNHFLVINKISKKQYLHKKYLYHFLRVISLSTINSLLLTSKYKGKRIENVWGME